MARDRGFSGGRSAWVRKYCCNMAGIQADMEQAVSNGTLEKVSGILEKESGNLEQVSYILEKATDILKKANIILEKRK